MRELVRSFNIDDKNSHLSGQDPRTKNFNKEFGDYIKILQLEQRREKQRLLSIHLKQP